MTLRSLLPDTFHILLDAWRRRPLLLASWLIAATLVATLDLVWTSSSYNDSLLMPIIVMIRVSVHAAMAIAVIRACLPSSVSTRSPWGDWALVWLAYVGLSIAMLEIGSHSWLESTGLPYIVHTLLLVVWIVALQIAWLRVLGAKTAALSVGDPGVSLQHGMSLMKGMAWRVWVATMVLSLPFVLFTVAVAWVVRDSTALPLTDLASGLFMSTSAMLLAAGTAAALRARAPERFSD